MNLTIQQAIRVNFSESQEADVISILQQVTLEQVMAESQTNLDNTWLAIIQLSKGDMTELQRLVGIAQKDFRDVIYWAGFDLQK